MIKKQRARFVFLLLLCFAPFASAQQAASNAAIASAHPLATQAGREILDHGGNAFDAAIAVAGVLAVVEPYNSGLGGGGFFLLHRASDRRQVMLDAREKAPLAARPNMYLDKKGEVKTQASLVGPLAAAIPGLPAGLAHLAKRYGRLPLRHSLMPAIRLAEAGFPIDARYRAMAESNLALLQSNPESAQQFLIDRAAPDVGEILKQPQLAVTLRALAQQGSAGFYRGPRFGSSSSAAPARASHQDLISRIRCKAIPRARASGAKYLIWISTPRCVFGDHRSRPSQPYTALASPARSRWHWLATSQSQRKMPCSANPNSDSAPAL